MAQPKQDSFGLFMTLGAFAVATLGLAFYLKRRDEAAAPTEPQPSPQGTPVTPTGPATAPDGPASLPPNDFKPVPKGASGFDQAPRPPFDHVLILYTSRWTVNGWGQWDGPTGPYDGRMVSPADIFHAAVWVNPEHEMLEYLEALTVTNISAGFWAAYKLPIIDNANGNGTHYGVPGPWVSGRFGPNVTNSDGSHVSVIFPADAAGHQIEISANQWA